MKINPEIFRLGPLSVRWYGVMVACGFLSAFLLGLRRSKRYGFTKDDVSDCIFWAVIGGLVGARLLYVIRFWEEFADNPLDILKIYQGGLVFLGGFAGAAVAILLLARRRKWEFWRITDFAAPMLPLGQAFGRIGCLLNGCCYGHCYHRWFQMDYPHLPYPVFPIQAVYSLAAFALCGLLLWLERRDFFPQRRFLVYLVCYCVGRFCLEFGRGDYPQEQLLLGLTPAQITCLWLLPLSCAIYAILAFVKRKREAK